MKQKFIMLNKKMYIMTKSGLKTHDPKTLKQPLKYKLVFKNMIGNNKIFEGTYDQVWNYLLKREGENSLIQVNQIFEIKVA